MKASRNPQLGSYLVGILFTCFIIGTIWGLERLGIAIPNPGVVLSVAVVLSSFVGGLRLGALSALLSVAYSSVYFSELGTLFTYDSEHGLALLVVSFSLASVAILVGLLKNRLNENLTRESHERARRQADVSYHQIVEAIKDYGIIKLDPEGTIVSINEGALRIKGYNREEIIGKSFKIFYPPEDVAAGKTKLELDEAMKKGRFEDEGWRVKKDGTRFWANVVFSALRDPETHEITGFVKVTRDLTERKKQEEALKETGIALSAANKELEAFSYSVSHDLRSPLRGIDGFSQALLEDYYDKLDEEGRDYLMRIRTATQRMGKLIDDLLTLSRLGRAQMQIEKVDLSALCKNITSELWRQDPQRKAEVRIEEDLVTYGDVGLLGAVFQNLISNAWKFTSKKESAQIEIGSHELNGENVFYVKDNGAGFNMAYSDKLFGAFHRLHHANEFSGTGVGLATVRRIIHRHGGKIWVEAEEGKGATFYFTLGLRQSPSQKAA